MKVFLTDKQKVGPRVFTTRCESCGGYYDELAERMLEVLEDPVGCFLCIQCDPDAEDERISLAGSPDENGRKA